jgi:hypothetical protein
MEPRRDDQRPEELKVARPQPEEKQKCFRLIKLEERIAPKGRTSDSNAQGYLSIE